MYSWGVHHDDPKWKHDLREILRSMVFNEGTFRSRKDMLGLNQVAYLPTMNLLQSQKSTKRLTTVSHIFWERPPAIRSELLAKYDA